MLDVQPTLEQYIDCISRLTDYVEKCSYSDLTPASAFFAAASYARLSRSAAFEYLEQVLTEHINQCEPNFLVDQFTSTLAERPGYWESNPISDGILDAAVQLHIITEGERASIRTDVAREISPNEDATPYIDRIRADVALLRRLTKTAEPTGTSSHTHVAPAASPEVAIDPQFDNPTNRTALEAVLGGTLVGEIEGTLGRIFVFEYPPSADVERIAVKTVDPTRIKVTNPVGALEKLAHEVRHWISYRHSPFIISPLFARIVHGWPYIAMPYCEGTLRQYIDRDVPHKGFHEAIALMVQAICGLEFAYNKGLKAHQDLKPENILIQDLTVRFALPDSCPFRWRARLADFGLANGYLELGVSSGSRPYLAPEQYDPGSDLAQVDIFACGVILYELITGKHPIGEITSEIWPNLKTGKPRHWKRDHKWKKWARGETKIPPDAHLGALHDVVVSALSTDPVERPTFATFKRELLASLKATDARAYEQLLLVLAKDECAAIYLDALDTDQDTARYQMAYFEQLSK